MPRFSWDHRKGAANLRKHEVSFEHATGVFSDPFAIDEIDDKEDYGEERWIMTGMTEGRLLVVVYTERNRHIHIISARKATRKERRKYEETR